MSPSRAEHRPLCIHVDRIASAWLIKRFIDPEACFKLVPGRQYAPRKGELRFDMFEGELTHEGDRCTFEVLLRGRAQEQVAHLRHADARAVELDQAVRAERLLVPPEQSMCRLPAGRTCVRRRL